MAGAVLRQRNGSPGRFADKLEGQNVSFGVHSGKGSLHLHIFIGGKAEVFGYRRVILLGEKEQAYGDGLAGGAVVKNGGKGEAGGREHGGGQRGETESADGTHGHLAAGGDHLTADGQHAGGRVGQVVENDGREALISQDQKVRRREGNGIGGRAVFGKSGHGDGLFLTCQGGGQ